MFERCDAGMVDRAELARCCYQPQISNSIDVRTPGFLWMWRNLFWISNATIEAPDCVQVKAGICAFNEVVMVSYWHSSESLKEFFRGESHRKMMQFTAKHPKSLCLYNETYQPSRTGNYLYTCLGEQILQLFRTCIMPKLLYL